MSASTPMSRASSAVVCARMMAPPACASRKSGELFGDPGNAFVEDVESDTLRLFQHLAACSEYPSASLLKRRPPQIDLKTAFADRSPYNENSMGDRDRAVPLIAGKAAEMCAELLSHATASP